MLKLNLEIKESSKSYCAEVVKVPQLNSLENCDNLLSFSLYGFNVLVSKQIKEGELGVIFPTECQLSQEFCFQNNLFRDCIKNKDLTRKGYIETNRRVKATKLRSHISSALWLPISSLNYLGEDVVSQLKEGDSFTHINFKEICCKYELPEIVLNRLNKSKSKSLELLALQKTFPEHVETSNYFRNEHKISDLKIIVITQKLHGSSGRFVHIPLQKTVKLNWLESQLKKFNLIKTPSNENIFTHIAGSRRVIKNNSSSLKKDVWGLTLEKVRHKIPKNVIFYGELVGWDGEKQIQKKYTYKVPKGQCELYIYRICSINEDGFSVDWGWDAVKEFCKENGLNYVPELFRGTHEQFKLIAQKFLDVNYFEQYNKDNSIYVDIPLPLDSLHLYDEGFVCRIEGFQPKFYKGKSVNFLLHESKQLDDNETDSESLES